jgi:phage terminase large subunit
MNLNIEVPEKLLYIWQPYRYKILYGGRSSGKTATAIRYLITRAMQGKCKILCTREFQSSIATSTYAELKDFIYTYNLSPKFFDVKHDRILSSNGSEFIFKGLARDIMQIKSIPNIDICFVEEAETIDEHLWDILIPSIRSANSEIIICFNPRERQSATYQRFIETPQKDNELRIEINYPDNPFNSETILNEIETLRINNYAKFEHIYLGKVLDMTEDVIFKGHFKVENIPIKYLSQGGYWHIENQRINMKYGIDFGFSVDPAAFVELCFLDKDTIYIHREIYETKLLPSKYIYKIKKELPESINKKWYGDNSRPDTIAELEQLGLSIEGAEKGKGSIESGIEYLLGKNIIINPSCTNMIYEAYNYRYKTDKNTGNITTDIIDANNHLWDAIRYALCNEIQAVRKGISIQAMQNYFKGLNYVS